MNFQILRFSALAIFLTSSLVMASPSILNTGARNWPIVVQGTAAPDAQASKANALPAGDADWAQMQGWKRPKIVTGTLLHLDPLGVSAAEFNFQIILLYGGSKAGKKGSYIGYASIIARDATVLTGDYEGEVSLNSNVSVLDVRNVGTEAEPVAEMVLELESKLTRKQSSGEVTHQTRRLRYRLNGLGDINRISDTTRASVEPSLKVRGTQSFANWQNPISMFRTFGGATGSWDEVQTFACPHPINPYAGISGSEGPSGMIPLVVDNKIMENKEPLFSKALPRGLNCWNQLKAWHQEVRQFEYRWVNSLWWDFVVRGEIVWLAGATDYRGKGRYIGFVSAKVNSVSRGIIKNVNISAHAPAGMISNVGTSENPVPSIALIFKSKLTSGAKTELANWLLTVDGMGNISDVTHTADRNY